MAAQVQILDLVNPYVKDLRRCNYPENIGVLHSDGQRTSNAENHDEIKQYYDCR
ncbi:hypothetical protein OROGR_004863 [Orobanche gracilis]